MSDLNGINDFKETSVIFSVDNLYFNILKLKCFGLSIDLRNESSSMGKQYKSCVFE